MDRMVALKYAPFIGGWLIAGTTGILLLKRGGYTIHRVEGPSMQPTLKTNDFIVVKKIKEPQTSNLAVNSIISLHHPKQNNSFLIKRLTANENEIVDASQMNSTNHLCKTKVIPRGHCWVQSDAGPGYLDSTSYLGPISYDKVVGVALYIIWPPRRIQML